MRIAIEHNIPLSLGSLARLIKWERDESLPKLPSYLNTSIAAHLDPRNKASLAALPASALMGKLAADQSDHRLQFGVRHGRD